MRRLVIAVCLWVVAIGLWTSVITSNIKYQESKIPSPYQELYEEVLAPCVRITSPQGTGSGVLIATTDKHRFTQIDVLTAAHVVGDEREVQVIHYSYHQDTKTPILSCLSAFVVMTDTVKDLALLTLKSNTCNLKSARLAPRDYVPYLFTPVYAVGCSLGLNPRPSEGIVNAIDSSTNAQNDEFSYWEITAPILPGNSGGGVFDKETRHLIGIAVWVRTYQGQLITTMAGIVPINQIHEFLSKASVSFQYGEVSERRARVTGAIRLIDVTCSNRVCSEGQGRQRRPQSHSKNCLLGTQHLNGGEKLWQQ